MHSSNNLPINKTASNLLFISQLIACDPNPYLPQCWQMPIQVHCAQQQLCERPPDRQMTLYTATGAASVQAAYSARFVAPCPTRCARYGHPAIINQYSWPERSALPQRTPRNIIYINNKLRVRLGPNISNQDGDEYKATRSGSTAAASVAKYGVHSFSVPSRHTIYISSVSAEQVVLNSRAAHGTIGRPQSISI